MMCDCLSLPVSCC